MFESKAVSMKESDIMPDTNIVARFDEIYDSTNKLVLAYITSKCGNTADINDIFQETYMELYQRLQKRGADYVKDGKAFVLKIAKNKIFRHYTIAERLRIFVSMTAKNEDSEYEEIELSDAEADAFIMEDSVINQIILENAQQFIQQKSKNVEKIFYLFYDVGLSIPEIAKTLSLTESNVKNKLYRTIKELQNLLNER